MDPPRHILAGRAGRRDPARGSAAALADRGALGPLRGGPHRRRSEEFQIVASPRHGAERGHGDSRARDLQGPRVWAGTRLPCRGRARGHPRTRGWNGTAAGTRAGLDRPPCDHRLAPSPRHGSRPSPAPRDREPHPAKTPSPRSPGPPSFDRRERCPDIAELLAFFRELQRRFDLAVILVHHTRKNSSGPQAGQNLRGSSDLHAFGDSNLYLRRTRDRLLLVMEHRAASPPDPVYLELVTRDEDAVHLEVRGKERDGAERRERELEERVLEALGRKTAITRGDLREKLGVKNERLGEILDRLQAAGRIERCRGGWRPRGAFPIPPPREGNGNDVNLSPSGS